jgi:hypothetical protein
LTDQRARRPDGNLPAQRVLAQRAGDNAPMSIIELVEAGTGAKSAESKS